MKDTFVAYGPQGGISISVSIPENGGAEQRKYPLVILMHGVSASKDFQPFLEISDALLKEGIASLRFDFQAHGESEGDILEMTISKEIEDARAVFEYACSLPFVSDITFLGHSQGGLVASMLAGMLENDPRRPDNLILLAPAVSIKDDVLKGRYLTSSFNPVNPPECVNVLFSKISRQFILDAQTLPIHETTPKYSGKVKIIHGEKDIIVPLHYSQDLQKEYARCELEILPKEGHTLNYHIELLIGAILNFAHDNIR